MSKCGEVLVVNLLIQIFLTLMFIVGAHVLPKTEDSAVVGVISAMLWCVSFICLVYNFYQWAK